MNYLILSAPVLCLAFLAVLFTQSGLDKVFNYQENKDWLTGHFEKSPLKGTVGFLLPVITLLETAAGLVCAAGIYFLLFQGNNAIGLLGTQLSALSLLSLFFGQRVAKDYAGAATLVPYFLLTIFTMYLLWAEVQM